MLFYKYLFTRTREGVTVVLAQVYNITIENCTTVMACTSLHYSMWFCFARFIFHNTIKRRKGAHAVLLLRVYSGYPTFRGTWLAYTEFPRSSLSCGVAHNAGAYPGTGTVNLVLQRSTRVCLRYVCTRRYLQVCMRVLYQCHPTDINVLLLSTLYCTIHSKRCIYH